MNKKERIVDLIYCYITAFVVILAIWFFASIIEVWNHNNNYYFNNNITTYSEYNCFEIIKNL